MELCGVSECADRKQPQILRLRLAANRPNFAQDDSSFIFDAFTSRFYVDTA